MRSALLVTLFCCGIACTREVVVPVDEGPRRDLPELGVTIGIPPGATVTAVPWRPGHYTKDFAITLPTGETVMVGELGPEGCRSQPGRKKAGDIKGPGEWTWLGYCPSENGDSCVKTCSTSARVTCAVENLRSEPIANSMLQICSRIRVIAAEPMTARPIPWLGITVNAPANALIVETKEISSIPRMANPPAQAPPVSGASISLGARHLADISQQIGTCEKEGRPCLEAGDGRKLPIVCSIERTVDTRLSREICASMKAAPY